MNQQEFRLHTAQQDVFIDQLLNVDSPQYNIGGYIIFKGELRVNILKQVVNNAPSLFDAFKMRFDENVSDFTCFIAQDYQVFELAELDFSTMPDPVTDAITWMQDRLNQAYQMKKSNCLFEQVLIKINPTEHWLFGRFHHLVMDGYGFTVWIQYMAAKYKSILTSTSFDFRYPSYIEEAKLSNAAITDPAVVANDHYWKEKIKVKHAPVLKKKYSVKEGIVPAASSSFVLNQQERIQLENLAQKIKCGISQITLAALIIYFGKTTHLNRFCFGLPVHKRNSAKRRKIVGLFNSFIPFEGLYQPDQTIHDLLRSIVATQSADYRHHDFKLSSLTSHLHLNAAEDRLWDVIVNYLPFDFELDFGDGIDAAVIRMVNEYERIPLQLCWNNYGNDQPLELQIHYLKEYFTEDDIRFFFNRILHILLQFSDSSNKKLSEVEVLPPSEQVLLENFGRNSLTENYFEEPIPFEDYLVQILDQSGQLIPIGMKGELCISQMENRSLRVNNQTVLIRKGIQASWTADGELVIDRQAGNSGTMESDLDTTDVNICASFVAEPLEEFINYWSKEFDLNLRVKFAPYNQLFQQLLDPNSLFNSGTGVNVLLLRVEDWLRDQLNEPAEKQITFIQNLYIQFSEALISAGERSSGNCLYAVVPWILKTDFEPEVVKAIRDIEEKIRHCLSVIPLFYELQLEKPVSLYQVDTIFDQHSDAIGHIPFTDEMFAATGTYLCRSIRAWKGSPYKVIALDCDNTLWKGICGEVGAMNVVISEEHAYLQRFFVEKYEQGFLIVLSSKNNEEDVWEVFDNHPGMILKREHILNYKINWLPKPDNLVTLADELNLGINSFIFLDDSDFEIAQMELAHPELLSLTLPAEQEAIPAFLDHIWAFDVFKVTETDRQRNGMYKAEQSRKVEQVKYSSIDDFIATLQVEVTIRKLGLQDLDRAVQLSMRTNQFNLNGVARSYDYISKLLHETRGVNWMVEVKDKFGDYGVVGMVLAKLQNNSLVLNSLFLSCRVLGRGVEDKVLEALVNCCLQNGANSITAMYNPSGKNTPFADFLKRTNWMVDSATGSYSLMTNPILKEYINEQ